MQGEDSRDVDRQGSPGRALASLWRNHGRLAERPNATHNAAHGTFVVRSGLLTGRRGEQP
jgi:hypothetical protein